MLSLNQAVLFGLNFNGIDWKTCHVQNQDLFGQNQDID